MSGLFRQPSISLTRYSGITLQNSSQGLPIPIVYGKNKITGNIIWFGDFQSYGNTQSGGKGGGSSITSYTYAVAVALGLCEGPINSIGTVWSNSGVTTDANLGFSEFIGATSQSPWSYLTTNHPDQALHYGSTAYVAAAALNLGSVNSMPQLQFEVEGFYPTISVTTPVSAYATLDPTQVNYRINLSGGNLVASMTATPQYVWGSCKANVYSPAGNTTDQLYFEVTLPTPANTGVCVGIANPNALTGDSFYCGIDANGVGYAGATDAGGVYSSNNDQFSTTWLSAGLVIGCKLDRAAHTVEWTFNGTSGGTYTLFDVSNLLAWTPCISLECISGTTSVTCNFGASAWAHAPGGSFAGWYGVAYSPDVTPAAVTHDLLTNTTYGALWPTAQLDSLADWDSYCLAAGLLVSPAFTSQTAASSIISELAQIGNASPVWSEGILKVIPYCDSPVGGYTPNTTVSYSFTDDDFIAASGEDPVKITRKRQADAFNSVSVSGVDRGNSYNACTYTAQDQALLDQFGILKSQTYTFNEICLVPVIQLVAQTLLQREAYFRNLYEFTVGWGYARVEPMDLVELTDTGLGLNQKPVRVLSVTEDAEGNLKMQAEDWFGTVSNAEQFAVQRTGGYVPNAASPPGNASTPVIYQPPLSISGSPQIWIGTAGDSVNTPIVSDWGGCEVWVSSNGGSSYSKFGTITAPATFGVLTAPLAAGADPDTTNTLSVDLSYARGALSTVPQSETDALITLCVVDSELLAYETATLTSAFNYNLTYLRRGQGWTNSAAHLVGATFMRLDSAVLKLTAPSAWVGTNLYIKLLSFNSVGASLQSLADVPATVFPMALRAMEVFSGLIPTVIPSSSVLQVPPNTAYNAAARMAIEGRVVISSNGRLRASNINTSIAIDPTGSITGLTSGSGTPVANSNVSIDASGALHGAGDGSVTITGLGYTGALNATTNTMYNQATDPGGADGDTWYDTANTTFYIKQGGAWVAVGDITSGKVAASIAGQGSFATINQITSANSGTLVGANAVTTALIAAGAVGTTQIANNAVTTALIANAAVGTTQIANNAVTTALLSSGAVGITNLASGLRPVEILGVLPAAGIQGRVVLLTTDNKLYRDTGVAWTVAVAGADIVANSITAGQIAAGTITTTQIAAATIVGGNIVSGTITSGLIAANTIVAGNIASGTITGTQIAANTIVANNIAANVITAAQIAANTITSAQIATGTITAAQIATGTITAAQMATGTITAASGVIADLAVTDAKIANLTVTKIKIGANELVGTGWNYFSTAQSFTYAAATTVNTVSMVSSDDGTGSPAGIWLTLSGVIAATAGGGNNVTITLLRNGTAIASWFPYFSNLGTPYSFTFADLGTVIGNNVYTVTMQFAGATVGNVTGAALAGLCFYR